MNAFEHILILLSFVFAIGIAHILSSVAALIRAGRRVRWSWVHGLWMLTALHILIADWIAFWDMRGLPSWSTGTILFIFLLSFTNYMAAVLVCPEVPHDGPVDLAQFHVREGRKYLIALLICYASALLANMIYGSIFNLAQWDNANAAVLPSTLAVLAALLWRKDWVQRAAPVLVTVLWVYYWIVLQGALK